MSKSLFSSGADDVAQIINSPGLYTTWHSAPAVILLSGSYDSYTGGVPGSGLFHQSMSPTNQWWIARLSLWQGLGAHSHTPDFYQLLHTPAETCPSWYMRGYPENNPPPPSGLVQNETNPNVIMSLIMHLIQL